MKFLLILFLIASFTARSQDCPNIRRTPQVDGSILIINNSPDEIMLTKTIKSTDTTYYATVRVESSMAMEDAKGVVFFFDDTDPKKYPDAKVAYRNIDGVHTYTATAIVNATDAVLFGKYKVATVKVFLFSRDLSNYHQIRFRKNAQCVLKAI